MSLEQEFIDDDELVEIPNPPPAQSCWNTNANAPRSA
jgi:hypothetical protein